MILTVVALITFAYLVALFTFPKDEVGVFIIYGIYVICLAILLWGGVTG